MMNRPAPLRAALRSAAFCGLLASGLLASGLPAIAQSAAPAPPAATAGATMTIAQLIDHLASTGYSDIKEVERKSDKLYEVKARDAKGLWVELDVDARSGEILNTKLDD